MATDQQQKNTQPPNQDDRGRDSARHRPPTGPTSIEGVEASDLPDGGRGSVETDPGKEIGRHLPQNTGEVAGSELNEDIGLGGHPDVRDADQENFLGRHQGDK